MHKVDMVSKKIIKKMRKSIDRHNMLPEGCRVLIAVSGGKDSIVMGLGLEIIKKQLKNRFETVWVHLNNGKENDADELEQWLKEMGIKLHVYKSEVQRLAQTKAFSSPCYLCAKYRRGALGDIAKRYECDRLALGHHLDDAIITLLMNLEYNGRFRTFKPISIDEKSGKITIRPLIYCEEKSIQNLAIKYKFPKSNWQCDHEKNSERRRMQQISKTLSESMPNINMKFMHAFYQLKDIDSWDHESN